MVRTFLSGPSQIQSPFINLVMFPPLVHEKLSNLDHINERLRLLDNWIRHAKSSSILINNHEHVHSRFDHLIGVSHKVRFELLELLESHPSSNLTFDCTKAAIEYNKALIQSIDELIQHLAEYVEKQLFTGKKRVRRGRTRKRICTVREISFSKNQQVQNVDPSLDFFFEAYMAATDALESVEQSFLRSSCTRKRLRRKRRKNKYPSSLDKDTKVFDATIQKYDVPLKENDHNKSNDGIHHYHVNESSGANMSHKGRHDECRKGNEVTDSLIIFKYILLLSLLAAICKNKDTNLNHKADLVCTKTKGYSVKKLTLNIIVWFSLMFLLIAAIHPQHIFSTTLIRHVMPFPPAI